MILNNIGSHLETLRLSLGYSLRKASQLSNLSHGYIRDVEVAGRKTGSQMIPRPQTLRKFAYAYNTDFNELMKIAGHTEEHSTVEMTFNITHINLDDVMFVKVDDNNHVHFHMRDRELTDKITLSDYMLLEDRLESANFIRIHTGTYTNLDHIVLYDEIDGRIYFDKTNSGKYVNVSWFLFEKIKDSILNSITINNNTAKDISLFPSPPYSLIVRESKGTSYTRSHD